VTVAMCCSSDPPAGVILMCNGGQFHALIAQVMFILRSEGG
jgi:hypothetical protein